MPCHPVFDSHCHPVAYHIHIEQLCSRQVFEIYDALPNPSPSTMNDVVKNAVNLCSASYICVGFFGYVTFCTSEVGGKCDEAVADKYMYSLK